jgi:hypothetical protein
MKFGFRFHGDLPGLHPRKLDIKVAVETRTRRQREGVGTLTRHPQKYGRQLSVS